MFHTLEEWSISLIKEPRNESLWSAMADWLTEQGWHNFDVGDDVFSVNSSEFRPTLWIENCRPEHIVAPATLTSGRFISMGSKKICVRTSYRIDTSIEFWQKFLCSNEEKVVNDIMNYVKNYIDKNEN